MSSLFPWLAYSLIEMCIRTEMAGQRERWHCFPGEHIFCNRKCPVQDVSKLLNFCEQFVQNQERNWKKVVNQEKLAKYIDYNIYYSFRYKQISYKFRYCASELSWFQQCRSIQCAALHEHSCAAPSQPHSGFCADSSNISEPYWNIIGSSIWT